MNKLVNKLINFKQVLEIEGQKLFGLKKERLTQMLAM